MWEYVSCFCNSIRSLKSAGKSSLLDQATLTLTKLAPNDTIRTKAVTTELICSMILSS